MRVTPIISLGLSVVVGIGAIVLGRVWLTDNADASATAISAIAPAVVARDIKTTKIAVLKEPLDNGVQIDLELIEFVDWPTKYLPEGAITEKGALVNADGSTPYTKGVVLAGEPLVMDKLSVQPVLTKLAARIEPGMRAISIKVTPDTGVSGLVLPGDRVDIASVRTITNPTTLESRSTVRTVLRNVLILAADQTFDATIEGAKVARNVTVEVSAADASRLAIAESSGTLFLTLRSEKQDEAPKPEPVSQPRPIQRRPRPPAPKPAPKPKGPEFTSVRIFEGDNSTIVKAPVADSATGLPTNLLEKDQ